MGINLLIGEKIIPINESQLNLTGLEFNSEQSRIIREQFRWDLITEMMVSNINDYKFYVKDYQRGYRWSATEVEALLDDIAEINNEKYCMQPLVIRTTERQSYNKVLDKDYRDESGSSDFYEVIDGQQRLTTILLILNHCEADIRYSIYYEQFRDVDKRYMDKANEAIEKWFKENNQDKKQICKKIMENLFFVWYQIGENKEESSEKIFNTVNSGKVELTNAELFRALLLKANEENNQKEQIEQIAFEWDTIEQSLKNDEFWYFIAGDENKETTRIDYILELYARVKDSEQENKSNSNPYNDERFSFNIVKKEIQNGTDPFEVWKEIVEVYERLYSWYFDDTLYHLIGFLVCCEEDKKNKNKNKKLTSDIVYKYYKRNQNKIALQNELWLSAKKEIYGDPSKKEDRNNKKTAENYIDKIENVRYDDYTSRVLRAVFLFFNVWTYMQTETKGRFSFYSYKTEKWDIEHINPQNLNEEFKDDINETEKEAYIAFLKQYAEGLEKSDDLDDKKLSKILQDIISQGKDKYDEIWKNCVKKINENGLENNIKNLTLLNSSINRSYGNAFFTEKRKEIIANDEKGVFIPACTKNVFLKYYSQKDVNSIAWTAKDKESYFDKLNECFIELKNVEEKSFEQ